MAGRELQDMLAHPLLGPWMAAQEMKAFKQHQADLQQAREWKVREQQHQESQWAEMDNERLRRNQLQDMNVELDMNDRGATKATPGGDLQRKVFGSNDVARVQAPGQAYYVPGPEASRKRLTDAANAKRDADYSEFQRRETFKAGLKPDKGQETIANTRIDENGNTIVTQIPKGAGTTNVGKTYQRPTPGTKMSAAEIRDEAYARAYDEAAPEASQDPKVREAEKEFETAKGLLDVDKMDTAARLVESYGGKRKDHPSGKSELTSIELPTAVNDKSAAFKALVAKHKAAILKEQAGQGVATTEDPAALEKRAVAAEQRFLTAIRAGKIPASKQVELMRHFKEQFHRPLNMPVSGAAN